MNRFSSAGRSKGSRAPVNVPLLDLVAQYQTIKDDVVAAMMSVVENLVIGKPPLVVSLPATMPL